MGTFVLLSCDQQETQPKTEKIVSLPEYNGTIIAVGDSLTAGLGVMENKALKFRLNIPDKNLSILLHSPLLLDGINLLL